MEVQQIPIGVIKPSPMNPRKTFDEGGLQELADNIKRQGLLQPITVRPVTDDHDPLMILGYEIVCGERRYRAMKLIAESDDYKVPCIVRVFTDAEAFDAMITENLQRQDVDPVEEAFAFNQLVKRGDRVEDIAMRFGKTARFVTDRIKLNNLIPELLLKLRDGDMAISAAMIISKLDEEKQRTFFERFKNYGTIGKDVAVRYCNEIFQYIANSAWVQDERSDFAGGCGVKCEDCPCNTQNSGCLFYEMKATDTTAKCIDKERFVGKKLAYMMSKIDDKADQIVKAGEPLEFGKIAVVADIASYCNDKEQAKRFVEQVKAKGYEVFNRDDIFDSYSYYDEDDERLQEKLANHEVYHCLNISSFYSGVEVTDRYYHPKKDISGVDNETIQEGVTAMQLAEKYRKTSAKCKQERDVAVSRLFSYDNELVRSDELSEEETEALVAYMLSATEWQFRKDVTDRSERLPMDAYFDYVVNHPDDRHKIMREWLRVQLNRYEENTTHGTKAQESVAGQWKPTELAEIESKYQSSLEKKTAKIVKQLDELGYTTDGKRK